RHSRNRSKPDGKKSTEYKRYACCAERRRTAKPGLAETEPGTAQYRGCRKCRSHRKAHWRGNRRSA
ncbi:MAG: hypothetical protein IJT94_03720, partial [Oscillibacter sp.]|nr:hypothetical protein [Oscillibacter sp.]